ncbi:unnamed protein product [Prorocentrum cordatum]|uniref:NADP-dependent oxidoreductase domain-containing protein n=1 Tax=Prorocentrum cordatum TaxID=2364126 RepID=A0ABN9QP13_9DINO|nr:unnamed protein product [Polarella glacialis]
MLAAAPAGASSAAAGIPRLHVYDRIPSAPLSNGRQLPLLGLGCASGVRREHVLSALRLGYTHFDTAQAYRWGYHEDEVGAAIDESGVPREGLFIQTKVFPAELGYNSTMRSFNESLARLRSESVDSLLIHKPTCWGDICDRKPEGTWQDSWRALEELYEAGRARAIGICDADDRILQQLSQMKHNAHIVQNWMDPFHQDRRVRGKCEELGIRYQAYSTLGTQWGAQGHRENPVMNSPTLQRIANAHGRTVAQVVLNWAIGKGVAVIPASKQEARQRSNLACLDFELAQEEIAEIDALDGTLERPRAGAQKDSGKLEVKFRAGGDHRTPLKAFWVDQQGEEVPVGELALGGVLGLSTYHGHRFRFKSGGAPVAEHVVNSGLARGDGGSYVHVVEGRAAEL